ncbi:MAG: hypothetical protein QXH80_04740, partial [Candidatus Nanoarchaeia archaeon]
NSNLTFNAATGALSATTFSGAVEASTISASGDVTLNGSDNTFGNASTDKFTMVGRLIIRNVTDDGMTSTAGTKCELVYENTSDKVYVCTASGSPATWAALN